MLLAPLARGSRCLLLRGGTGAPHPRCLPAFTPCRRTPLRSCSTVAGGAATPGKVRVHATTAEGKTVVFTAPVGVTLMEAIRDTARLDIEAACDGTCACSTCHVILGEDDYAKLDEPSEDEMDMLDLAPAVTKTSRLACQVQLTDALDGITVQMPSETQTQLR